MVKNGSENISLFGLNLSDENYYEIMMAIDNAEAEQIYRACALSNIDVHRQLPNPNSHFKLSPNTAISPLTFAMVELYHLHYRVEQEGLKRMQDHNRVHYHKLQEKYKNAQYILRLLKTRIKHPIHDRSLERLLNGKFIYSAVMDGIIKFVLLDDVRNTKLLLKI